MRLKIRDHNANAGWRVEFRPMEVQLTDIENAACCIFVVLYIRAALTLGVDMLVPMSKVEESMGRAQKRDAVRKERIWFCDVSVSDISERGDFSAPITRELSVDEIVNGTVCFIGSHISILTNIDAA